MLQLFSDHLAFCAIFLIWLITLFALIYILHYARGQKRKYAECLQQERRFYEAVEKEGMEGYAMIRMSDHCPLYVSKSLENLFGIPCDLLEKDLEFLMQITEPDVYRDFRRAWEKWSYILPLVFDFPFTHPKTQESRWGQVVVTCVDNGRNAILLFRDITDRQTRLHKILETALGEKEMEIDEEMEALIKRLLTGQEGTAPEAEEQVIEKEVEELLKEESS